MADKLIIYETKGAKKNQRYRWRYEYANGRKGPRSEEGFSSSSYTLKIALKLINPARNFDVVDQTKKK